MTDPHSHPGHQHDGCLSPQELDALAQSSAPAPPHLEEHVARCADCRAALNDVRANHAFLRDVARLNSPHLGPPPIAPLPELRAAGDAGRSPGAPHDYELLEEIGRGGQGVVYRALHTPTRRTVAIKMLASAALATQRQRARFTREVEIAAALSHPNIVRLYDAWSMPDGRTAYSMEFIDGLPLLEWAHRAQERAPLIKPAGVLKAKITVLLRLCDAVNAAHQRGVIHRDLKPSNIIVDAADQPHVLDFGVAVALNADGDPADRLTRTQEFAGTLAYAAPEQVSDAHAVPDARTDIYALGVVLYQVLTGRLPFDAALPVRELVQNICTAEPAPMLSPDLPRIDHDLQTITLTCLAKHKDRRYQSARDLKADLERFLAGLPIAARRDSTWYVLRTLARRHRRALFGVGLIAAALLAALGVTLYTLTEARVARAREAAERARAEQEAETSRVAARLIQEIFPIREGSPRSPEVLGARVAGGLDRTYRQMVSGLMAADPSLGPTGLFLYAGLNLSPAHAHIAEAAIRQALPKLHSTYGSSHIELARAWNALGRVQSIRLRHDDAAFSLRRALDIRLRLLEPRDPHIAETRILLARALVPLGRTDEAQDHLALAQLALTPANPDAPSTATDSIARAHLYTAQSLLARSRSDWSAAQAHALDALAARAAVFPEWHTDYVEALFLVADSAPPPTPSLSADAGPPPPRAVQLARALRLHSAEALPAALRSLAVTLSMPFDAQDPDPGAQARALDALYTHLPLKRQLLGSDHTAIARSLLWIGTREADRGKFRAAEAAFVQAIPILARSFDENDVALASCWERVQQTRAILGDHAGAAFAGARALDIWAAQPPGAVDDIQIPNVRRYIAQSYALAGDFDRALNLYSRALDDLTRAAPTHYLVGVCRVGQGWCTARLGRLDDGEQLIRSGLEKLQFLPGDPRYDQNAWASVLLADVLRLKGRPADAARPATQAVEWLRTLTSPTYLGTRSIALELAIRIAQDLNDDATKAALTAELDAVRAQIDRLD